MKIQLSDSSGRLAAGLSIIAEDLGFELGDSGLIIHAVCSPGGVSVSINGDAATVKYEEPCHFYRGLAILSAQLNESSIKYAVKSERPGVKHVGVSLDVSRNAAPDVTSIKHFLRKMSLMGMDRLMLYMEDMYPVEGYDKFGYMRGRYSRSELKAIDDYAYALGIEVIPYIQTLAHLSQVLKWEEMSHLRDTIDILLVDDNDTYELIDKMLTSLSDIFRSRRVNLGMDEAHDLGLGNYLSAHGYHEGHMILQRHLFRVAELAEKHGLTGMIASDMLFSGDNKAVDHYELGSSLDCAMSLPTNIDLMYWDYFHTDTNEIAEFIRRHKSWGKKPTYLGTVRTWESFATSYTRSFKNTRAAIKACIRENVEEAIISVWMNDGAENSFLAAIPGVSYFAQQVYNADIDESSFRMLFSAQTGSDFDSFLLLEKIDEAKCAIGSNANLSKYLLWQDPLLGLFDFHIANRNLSDHYKELSVQMRCSIPKMGEYRPLMELMAKLCEVLSVKSEIGVRIKEAYDKGSMSELKQIADDILPALEGDIDNLRELHYSLWMSTLKPFGFEVIDGRYGAQMARLRTARVRLSEYVSGRIASIPELEENRLPFCQATSCMPNVLTYDRIVSVGYQNGPVR